jgi:NAD(P)-dependent dehydrogenase (short-subunit alcohol dehydrogenase family)
VETGGTPFIADIRDEVAVAAAFAAIDERFGRVDGLVANAGVMIHEHLIHELDSSAWDLILDTDLRGTYLVVREALARMVRSSAGSIVCVSSIMAHGGIPGAGSAYTAAKGGVEAFARSVAVDYAPWSIRCNVVAPGPTETPMMWVTTPEDAIEKTRDIVRHEVPLGRLADPIDIAQAIVWLLSPESSYITGVTLLVDGGARARLILSV